MATTVLEAFWPVGKSLDSGRFSKGSARSAEGKEKGAACFAPGASLFYGDSKYSTSFPARTYDVPTEAELLGKS